MEAFTIGPLCHHLNYLASAPVHTGAALARSGCLITETSHLLRNANLVQADEQILHTGNYIQSLLSLASGLFNLH